MCLNPIRLPRVTGSDAALVPCGKCAECMANKANDLTVRVVREAEYFKDFYFTTFTYDNDHMPFQVTDIVVDSDFCEFVSSSTIVHDSELSKEFFDNASYTVVMNKEGRPVKRYEPLETEVDLMPEDPDVFRRTQVVYYTVDNEDVKKFLKSARMYYMRHKGEPLPKFKYLVVPEYGGCSYRPHYHILWLGLKREHIDFLVSRWKYGQVADVQQVSYTMEDMSKVAHYVSQYANKGSQDVPYIRDEYCKKPRRCFSINFGLGDEEDLARREAYWKCEDIYGKYNPNDLSSFSDDEKARLVEDVQARRYYDLCGFKYPIPQYIKKRVFYVKRSDVDLQRLSKIIPKEQIEYEQKRLYEKCTVRKRRQPDGTIKYSVCKPSPNAKVATELQQMVTVALFEHLRRDLTSTMERQLAEEVQHLVEVTPENIEQLNSAFAASQEDTLKVSELHLQNKIANSIF